MRSLRGPVYDTCTVRMVCGPSSLAHEPFSPGLRARPATLSADLDAPALISRWLAGEQEDPEIVLEIGPMVLTLPEAQRHAAEVKRPAAVVTTLQEGIVSIQDYRTRQPYLKVFLALVPCPTTWDAPVRLGFGGFNGCPLPAEHAAVLRDWHRRYGLQVVSVTEDRLEFTVDRPPEDAAEALVLACEQFAYCPDLVHQGTGTTVELAGEVLNAPVWSFWWD
ncbi:DUF4253 domain-containing protein (plasmid) [Deinococcus sp. KNUC1210]|uniref:DUF4253 domain-containing protein n=1 Tax=Deinococcus sp. KNUC1210 TaxID=2917691 RepID=UPI001EF124E0|nr:DUF4253 domain-containing protein [Deinococcus sp. KNUC1210]ULH18361.1 DUF4253 domain-containing protein [Deinococcus sp. KNUC1210]